MRENIKFSLAVFKRKKPPRLVDKIYINKVDKPIGRAVSEFSFDKFLKIKAGSPAFPRTRKIVIVIRNKTTMIGK